ncbi:MAG: Txe/YoeB family addiction module toxin [Defluviitaleaceae bacterium]|nr:Txe/YoeB family addiction module toxin [Defluviitaleaceae bacterium]
MYKAILSRQAVKDLEKLKRAGASYARKAKWLVNIVSSNPYQNPPPYEKLVGDLQGYYSRRINEQHRFIYDVLPNIDNLKDENGMLYKGIVHILRMWTHYE